MRVPAMAALLVGRERLRAMCTRGVCASEGGYGQGYDCCRSLMRPVLALSFVNMALLEPVLEGELQAEM